MKILYFYISSHTFGSGHFKRAENYEKNFLKYKIFFKKENLVDNKNKLILQKIKSEKKIKFFDLIFLDVSNKFFFNNKSNNKKLKEFLAKYYKKMIIIDGIDRETLTNDFQYKYKGIIIPYTFNKKKLRKIKKVKYFLGSQFFITKQFKKVKINNENLKNIKILFTSGGSDTENSTLKFLRLFNLISANFIKLFIILGPNYLKSNIIAVKKFCKIQKINVKFLTFKSNIFFNAYNKDLIITSSGLTKYEVLFMKIPMVVFSENNYQKKLNHAFKNEFPGICLNNLSYNKKNLTILNKIVNDENYIRDYKKMIKENKMNNFKKIYNFIKNDF